MLQKSREIVLDTSRKLRIISHTERQPSIETYFGYGTRLNFIPNREALSHPQIVLPGSRIDLNDDSQLFVTALNLPEPAGSFAPPIVADWRGASLFRACICKANC
jgi:hypothetical protein